MLLMSRYCCDHSWFSDSGVESTAEVLNRPPRCQLPPVAAAPQSLSLLGRYAGGCDCAAAAALPSLLPQHPLPSYKNDEEEGGEEEEEEEKEKDNDDDDKDEGHDAIC